MRSPSCFPPDDTRIQSFSSSSISIPEYKSKIKILDSQSKTLTDQSSTSNSPKLIKPKFTSPSVKCMLCPRILNIILGLLILSQKFPKMASQQLNLTVNAPASSLNVPFGPGQTIIFTSNGLNLTQDTSGPQDNSNVNITNGNDILLTVSVRRVENRIVCDTRRGTTWDNKFEVVAFKGTFQGNIPSITITNTATEFIISFDNRIQHHFRHRIQVNGTGIQYKSTEKGHRIFSDIINAVVLTPNPPACKIMSSLLYA